jgi:hypothetical protein
VQLAKDQAKRIDSAMGITKERETVVASSPPVPGPLAILPAVAPARHILTRTPTQATTTRKVRKVVNFAGKERPIPVRKTTPKRGDLDCPVQLASVSAHVESTEAEPEEQEDEDMEIADDQEEETPDEQEGDGEGDVVEDTVMDVVPAPDVQKHVPRKIKKEKSVRVMPRLYQHMRAQLLEPPKSFLMEDDEDEEEESEDEGEIPPSQAEIDDEDSDADVEDNIEPTLRTPKKRRAISTSSAPYVPVHESEGVYMHRITMPCLHVRARRNTCHRLWTRGAKTHRGAHVDSERNQPYACIRGCS